MITTLKNYLQTLSWPEQTYAIKDMLDLICTTDDTIINVKKKDKMITELKEIRHRLLLKQ